MEKQEKTGCGVNDNTASGEQKKTALYGLYMAVVKKLDNDPLNKNRIQVELPWIDNETEKLFWAHLSTFYATGGAGSFFLPEPGDKVLVGFINGDLLCPVILGGMYDESHNPPYKYEANNNKKAIVTRNNMRIELDEDKKTITISTPGENRVELSDNGKYLKLTDENKNEITMDNGGITFLSSKDVIMRAKGSIQMCADADINWNAQKDACLEGLNVNVRGKVSAIVKGDATAELSASGQTTVKGAMVMIN